MNILKRIKNNLANIALTVLGSLLILGTASVASATVFFVQQGGTATSTYVYGVVVASGTNAFSTVIPGADGQVLTVSGGAWVSSSSPASSGGTGTVTTSSVVTTLMFPYWATSGGLNGTSTLSYSASGNTQLLQNGAFNASGTITSNGKQLLGDAAGLTPIVVSTSSGKITISVLTSTQAQSGILTSGSSTNYDSAYNSRIQNALSPLTFTPSTGELKVATATQSQNGILVSGSSTNYDSAYAYINGTSSRLNALNQSSTNYDTAYNYVNNSSTRINNTVASGTTTFNKGSFSVSLIQPSSTTDGQFAFHAFSVPITFNSIQCYDTNGTSTINIYRNTSSTPITQGTAIIGNMTCGQSRNTTTTFAIATSTADFVLQFSIISTSGVTATDSVAITGFYTK